LVEKLEVLSYVRCVTQEDLFSNVYYSKNGKLTHS